MGIIRNGGKGLCRVGGYFYQNFKKTVIISILEGSTNFWAYRSFCECIYSVLVSDFDKDKMAISVHRLCLEWEFNSSFQKIPVDLFLCCTWKTKKTKIRFVIQKYAGIVMHSIQDIQQYGVLPLKCKVFDTIPYQTKQMHLNHSITFTSFQRRKNVVDHCRWSGT